jgi:hypothetical protein
LYIIPSGVASHLSLPAFISAAESGFEVGFLEDSFLISRLANTSQLTTTSGKISA